MSQDPFEVLQSVRDEETFIEFLEALRDDREASVEQEKLKPSSPFEPDAGGWENTTIERFFDSAVAWAWTSINGTASYTKSENPWRRCADIIYMGKIYE